MELKLHYSLQKIISSRFKGNRNKRKSTFSRLTSTHGEIMIQELTIGDKEKQKELVFGTQPEIKLVSPCKLDQGVIRHTSFEKKKYEVQFQQNTASITLFIPASGSGSRMFQFLYDFLENPNEENRSKIEKFLNHIEDFAFFELLPFDIKSKVRNYDISLDEFIAYILKPNGLNLGEKPKGLIPFHRTRSFVLNAFQEQLLQGLRIKEKSANFHFTINGNFENEIINSLKHIQGLTARDCTIHTSIQNPQTDAIAFDEHRNPVISSDQKELRRPSGHGALLENLESIDTDVVFIKNIDNIQHESKSTAAIEHFQYLGGLLTHIKDELQQLSLSDNKKEALHRLNSLYQFIYSAEEVDSMTDAEILEYINRPLRICGMVKNEGQPGGGPFWIDNNGTISKQIVEKAQIKMEGEQYRLMVQSQYFNPVLMALSMKDLAGKKHQLSNFADHSKYFIVDKKYEGQSIRFLERPGLWNGSMANWLTIFVEVPSEAFTPVKNVLDLLNVAHNED